MDTNTDAAPVAEAAAPPVKTPTTGAWLNRLQAGAHIAEIVGVLVVIASLFFLSAQIQQNTTQLRRADLNATHDHWSAIRLFIAGDRDIAAFWSASLNGAELDATDQLRFNALMGEHARATFQIWDRNRSLGIGAEDFIRSGAPPLARLICTAGGAVWWNRFQAEFPRDFVLEMDTALTDLLAGDGPGSGDPNHPCGGLRPAPEPAPVEG